jgi:hypothetical protein
MTVLITSQIESGLLDYVCMLTVSVVQTIHSAFQIFLDVLFLTYSAICHLFLL